MSDSAIRGVMVLIFTVVLMALWALVLVGVLLLVFPAYRDPIFVAFVPYLIYIVFKSRQWWALIEKEVL